MKADIIAFKSYTLLSRLIRWVTRKDVTHVAILVGDHLIMETSLFGVRLRPLRDREYSYCILRCPTLTEEQQIDITDFVMQSVGKGYDFKLLIGIGINLVFGKQLSWNNKDRYICIELILKAYESVGIDLLPNINTDIMTPEDLLTSEFLEIIDIRS